MAKLRRTMFGTKSEKVTREPSARPALESAKPSQSPIEAGLREGWTHRDELALAAACTRHHARRRLCPDTRLRRSPEKGILHSVPADARDAVHRVGGFNDWAQTDPDSGFSGDREYFNTLIT
jgi:hypothetical protein